MPRIVVFGKSKSRTRKVAHIARGFSELGNETLWMNPSRIRRWLGSKTDRYILKRIQLFKPDLIFIHSTDLPVELLEKVNDMGIITMMYYHDGWRVDLLPTVAQWGKRVNIFLSNARGLHDQYRDVGIEEPRFIVEGCDSHDHKIRHALLPLWKSDVAFIGAARPHEPRVSLIQKLQGICDVKVYGRNWRQYGIRPSLREVGPRGYSLICSGAKIVLGVDAVATIDGHWTNRLWLTLGCGGFHLTNYVPGMEEFFINRKHLVWFHSEEECVERVREYLEKPEERKKIACEGYRLVHEHHTFRHFAQKSLDIFQEYRETQKITHGSDPL